MTQLMRDRLGETVKEFEAILKPSGRIIFLGTPQSEETLYNSLLERGYETRIWPARYPKDIDSIYGNRLAPFLEERLAQSSVEISDPVDPDRFNELDLQEREASYGKAGFALQFMLDSRLSDLEKYPLKLKDFIVHPCDKKYGSPRLIWASSPELMLKDLPSVGFSGDYYYRPMEVGEGHMEYTGSVMSIDPSGRGADETGYSVVKILGSQLFVTESGGLKGGYDRPTLIQLAKVAQRNQVNRIVVEANFGDGMFVNLLRPVLREQNYSVTIEEVRHNKQKELRIIDVLEPLLGNHRLVLDPEIINKDYQTLSQTGRSTADNLKYSLMYQLSRITREKGSLRHDDRLDALAIACGYWVEQLAQSVDEAHKVLKDQRTEEELEKFLNGVLGRKPVENLWVKL
jgi:Holliday junction resolvasome RuvABC endonuclease subunit